jgi:GNAT superfamily N-acetyltransferase
MSSPAVHAVPAAAVRPLRQSVLRPTRTVESLIYDGDDDPEALHVVRYDAQGAVIGIATIVPDAAASWRIRGMAVHPDHRSQGIGQLLISACLDHARARPCQRIWCNARTPALSFYLRNGFTGVGDVFELPEIGPHLVMEIVR